jgi:hypothetical protein
LKRHEEILTKLANGELENQNRFRELLLGVKSVGKTYLLKLLHQFIQDGHDSNNVLSVFVSYDADKCSIIDSILEAIESSQLCRDVAELHSEIKRISDKWNAWRNFCIIRRYMWLSY